MAFKPTAHSGDVLFVLSSGKESLASAFFQRLVFDRFGGPWFSHVAVALNQRIAIEASTPPDEFEETWSGAKLGQGVRLQLLPDILIPARRRVILRHPDSASISSSEFDITAPHIATLFGSGYSTQELRTAATNIVPWLARLLPEGQFDWNASPDFIAQLLRADPVLRKDIERHLRASEFASATKEYFCSQLVATLLGHAHLLNRTANIITPCGLFDILQAQGWKDVTESDYGDEALAAWRQSDRSDWREKYTVDVKLAGYFHEHEYVMALTDSLKRKQDEFSENLNSLTEKLVAMTNK